MKTVTAVRPSLPDSAALDTIEEDDCERLIDVLGLTSAKSAADPVLDSGFRGGGSGGGCSNAIGASLLTGVIAVDPFLLNLVEGCFSNAVRVSLKPDPFDTAQNKQP